MAIPKSTQMLNVCLYTGLRQNKKIGAKPITMVPEIVVADKISGPKNTGIEPKTQMAIMAMRPWLTFGVFTLGISTQTNLENDEKAESRVEAAEVTIMRLISKVIIKPVELAMALVAGPSRPFSLADIPTKENKTMQVKPISVAQIKLRRVFLGPRIKALSVKTGS